MIFSCSKIGFPVGGSLVKTSTAAPATVPSATARASAASLMIPPRAQLTIRTPGLMILNSSSSMRFLVSLVRGVCTVIKSPPRNTVSRSARVMPICWALSSVTKGSYAKICIPKDFMRAATSAPTRPSPTTPRVLLKNSTPVYFLRFHSPLCRAELA